MRSLLTAVGLAPAAKPKPSRDHASRATGSRGGTGEAAERRGRRSCEPSGDADVDLASVAAATEQGILVLEKEARSLDHASLEGALAVLQRWALGLRRRQPRPDEPLASFRAQFLRSHALEMSFEALRRNTVLRSALLDRPLFVSAGVLRGRGPAEALLAELRGLLQLCLPRAAAPLAEPAMHAALAEPPECAATALAAVRALKEDWAEVVLGQSTRGLERRLDALTYELQKSSVEGASGGAGRGARVVSSDCVVVLASLCEALAKTQARADNRLAEASSALQALGYELVESAGGLPPLSGGTGGASAACPASAQAGERPVGDASNGGTGGLGGLGAAVASERAVLDGVEDDHAREQAYLESTLQHMEAKLFERPAPEGALALSGDAVECAVAVRSHLLEERAAAMEATRAALQRVRSEVAHLRGLDRQLAGMGRASDASCAQPRPGASGGYPLTGSAVAPAPPTPTADPMRTISSDELCAHELSARIMHAERAFSAEAQRCVGRLAEQMQQRREQLLAALQRHIDCERKRLYSGKSAEGTAKDVRELCARVDAALASRSSSSSSLQGTPPLRKGLICRARWMDGHFYDASVQTVLPDGKILVNWLRPSPSRAVGYVCRLTVYENGGDDTLHRVVLREEVSLDTLDAAARSCPPSPRSLAALAAVLAADVACEAARSSVREAAWCFDEEAMRVAAAAQPAAERQ